MSEIIAAAIKHCSEPPLQKGQYYDRGMAFVAATAFIRARLRINTLRTSLFLTRYFLFQRFRRREDLRGSYFSHATMIERAGTQHARPAIDAGL